MDLSHNRSCINSDVDGRLRRIFASENRQVNHGLPVLSTILCGKTQCRSSYAVDLLEHFDLFTHFFASSRHLGFEDVQAVVDLISDPVQISGLSPRLVFNDALISDLCDLTYDSFSPCNPLESSNPRIQSVVAKAICVGDERPAFTRNVVLFHGCPVNVEGLTHWLSLYRLSCTMQAFFEPWNRRIQGSQASPSTFGTLPEGRGAYKEVKGTTPLQRRNK